MNKVDLASLSKKERREIKRKMKLEDQSKRKRQANMIKGIVIALLLIVSGFGGWWGYRELSKPLPGQQIADLGREHVDREKWEVFEYNSNPPTSGPHDVVWTKAGIYDQPQGDGHLVHSLEHGYVILNYNCNLESEKLKVQSEKLATESGEMLEVDQSVEVSKEANLPTPLSDQECEELQKQLSDLANDKKLWKLVVVSSQNLDSRIALTAWTRIEKMDGFDRDRIVAFIDAHRNHGPEQTME